MLFSALGENTSWCGQTPCALGECVGRITSTWDLRAPLAAGARLGRADKAFLGGQRESLEAWFPHRLVPSDSCFWALGSAASRVQL